MLRNTARQDSFDSFRKPCLRCSGADPLVRALGAGVEVAGAVPVAGGIPGLGAGAVLGAANSVDLGAHHGIDERPEHLAHQVRGGLLELL